MPKGGPASDEVPCEWHKSRLTGRRCTRCGRAACSDCLVQSSVGSNCPACRKAAAPSVRQQVQFRNAAEHTLVTKALVAINVAIFLIGFVSNAQDGFGFNRGIDRVQLELATYGPAIRDGEVWRVITGGFLHFSLIHIGFNMLLLWQLGGMLERALGRSKFLLLYGASLVGGSLGALALSPDAFTGGASGAVFGLMGATAIAFWQRGVPITRTPVTGTIALNLVLTFAIPNISIGGHIGGLILGGIVGALLSHPRRPRNDRIGVSASVAAAVVALVLAFGVARANDSPNLVELRQQLIDEGQ
jgi:membrane associated rhomboid family serine protease